jgi:Zn-dependent M16 (insulinase) family peptidase
MTAAKPPAQEIELNTTLHGFHVDRIQPIPELHATAYVFTHEKTGARLLHLYNDDPENLFCIAFRTPVYDNTGVPHILEHSVLGGSKKFPVKDPFQEMLKGSLQTFLNALTYRDKTVYPVASQVEKDFFNLVDVYCDAVFNPLITEYTLYQEGWHFEVEDPSKPVSIKGIVYNEMKGVFSDFSSHIARKTMAGLMPDTTYAFESGGEPEHIPELTYERFTAFHRRFYHPSNSYTVLYGNLPSGKTLGFLNDGYLAHFNRIAPESAIRPQPLWNTPRAISFEAPTSNEDDGAATVLLSWIFGDSADPAVTLTGTILSHYLLGAESSPLKRALVDSGLGEDLDDLCGFGVEAAQSMWNAGLRKSRPERAQAIEELILATLRKQVEQGLDAELLEGALRQVEFHLREITGGSFPYHLRLADRCYNAWLYDGDPCAHLAFEGPLNAIKEQNEKGDGYFRHLIKRRLLDNTHRLRAVIVASSARGKELERESDRQAARLSTSFTQDDKKRYAGITVELRARQAAKPSPQALATLPRLTKNDLPRKGFEVPCSISAESGFTVYSHPIFTSGIVYCDIGFDCSVVPLTLIPYIPLYLEILRRCGTAGRTYEQMATRIALATGGIGTSCLCRTIIGKNGELLFRSFIHGKSLKSRFNEMLSIIRDILIAPDFTNTKQIKDILFEARNSLNASVIGNGHHLAMLLTGARLSRSRYVEELMNGISQLRFLEHLIRNDSIDEAALNLAHLHRIMTNRNGCVVSLTADDPSELLGDISSFCKDLPVGASKRIALPDVAANEGKAAGIEINAAVNFSARSWLLGAFDPEEHGRLFLLARHLSTGYLWDKVRVMGGAYGGMAVMNFGHPIFACASYRDPNIVSTLRHYEKSLIETAAGIDADALNTSIIGTIGRIDQPKSPHGKGFGETIDRLSGYTPEKQDAVRAAVLAATPEKCAKTAENIVRIKASAVAVLGNAASFDGAEKEGMAFEREPLLPG